MIKINNIFKNFKNTQVLKGVSLDVKKGEKIVIIGSSGSGKSTLLRCMNLLETPTYGEVWLENKLLTPVDPYLHEEIIKLSNTYKKIFESLRNEGKNIANSKIEKKAIKLIKENDLLNEKIALKEGREYNKAIKKYYKENHQDINIARQKMGMCFQNFNLFNNYTVIQNLILAPVELKLMTKEEANNRALKLLERIGLLDKKDNYVSSLSGGQKQRISIARAIVKEPSILILDDSVSAVDVKTEEKILHNIKEKRAGKTTIIVASRVSTVSHLDKILVLKDGSVEAFDSPSNLMKISPTYKRMVELQELEKEVEGE